MSVFFTCPLDVEGANELWNGQRQAAMGKKERSHRPGSPQKE